MSHNCKDEDFLQPKLSARHCRIVLSVGRNIRLGAAIVVAIFGCAMMASVPASANTISTESEQAVNANPCASAISGFVGNETGKGRTTTNAVDGSGTYSTVAGCNASGNQLKGVTVFGAHANAKGVGAVALGYNAQAAVWATAVGLNANASGAGAVALGFSAVSSGSNAVAIGSAGGDGKIPLTVENSTTASGEGAVAIGSNAKRGAWAQGADSVAIGGQATAAAGSALALGKQALVDEQSGRGIAIGQFSQTQASLGGIAVGWDSLVDDSAGGAAFGRGATVSRSADGAALGVRAKVLDSVGGLAVGVGTIVTGAGRGIAIGRSAAVTGELGIAMGSEAAASKKEALALGRLAKATEAGSVALGAGSVTAVVVGTSGVTINGKDYVFAGMNPASTVSVGGGGTVRTITNVAAGRLNKDSTDAVNGSQLHATNQSIEVIDKGMVELGDRAVKYEGAKGSAKDTVKLEGGNGTRVTNLAAGQVGKNSTDAVNGSQLHGLSESIASHLGAGGAEVKQDGTIVWSSYLIGGRNYTTVYGAFAAVDSELSRIDSRVTNLDGKLATIGSTNNKYFQTNSNGAGARAIGQESVAAGNGASTGVAADGAVALGQNATASNAGDVALGSGSRTQKVVNTKGTKINGKNYAFAGSNAKSTVSVGDVGDERTITNVAAGRLNKGSTDAVNGSQLHATNRAVEDLKTNVGGLTDGAVIYDKNADGSRANSLTLIGGDSDAPVLISNVADGIADHDAVNVSQFNKGLANTLVGAKAYTDDRMNHAVDTARNYTDQKFGQLNREIDEIRSEARQAAAIGLAAASLRYDDRPGKVSVGIGGGRWRGQGAMAFGLGYTSEAQWTRVNLSATTAGGEWGVGAGVSFTLN